MEGQIDIPNKSLFKLNEVCGLIGIKPYVLRFWEEEFAEIAPIVSSSGQKLYEHKDIEAICLIKKLLFEDKMTIEEAKERMGEFLRCEEEKFLDNERPNSEWGQPQLRRSFSELDLQKLTLAKEKLKEFISASNMIKKERNW